MEKMNELKTQELLMKNEMENFKLEMASQLTTAKKTFEETKFQSE